MRRKIDERLALSIFFICICVVSSYSRQDSIPEKKTEKIVVSEKRHTLDATRPGNIVDRRLLDIARPRQVYEALSLLPGLGVVNYGGLGAIKTMSIRGAGAAQTLILIDGERSAMAQNAIADLSFLPVGEIQTIEIERGGASALYGGNAMGGVVNIRTIVPDSGAVKFSGGYGSFGELTGNGYFAEQTPFGGISAFAEWQSSDGDYPFDFNQFGKEERVHRMNADFRMFSGSIRGYIGSARSPERTQLSLVVRSSRRGVPGAVLQGAVEMARARYDEDDFSFSGQGNSKLADAASLNWNAAIRFNNTTYRDPDSRVRGIGGINEVFFNRYARAECSYNQVLSASFFSTLAEVSISNLQGSMLQPDVGSNIIRRTAALSIRYRTLFDISEYIPVEIQTSVRTDWLSDVGILPSATTSLMMRPADNFTVRLSISRDFRAPSFNELYYLNFGTSNLLSEKAWSFSSGLTYSPWRGITLDCDVFFMNISDKILSVPISPVAWSAQNIGMVRSFGLELGAKAQLIDEKLFLQCAYTLQDVRDCTPNSALFGKLLPYTPQESFSSVLSSRFGVVSSGAIFRHSSFRYSLQGNQIESTLPDYGTLSAYIETDVSIFAMQSQLRLQCDNLLDVGYAVIRNYPAPGRTFRALWAASWE